jgi:hypothetical protein
MQQNITPQQQAIMLQLQQANNATQPQHQQGTVIKNGVSTTIKHLSDGDDQFRNAK